MMKYYDLTLIKLAVSIATILLICNISVGQDTGHKKNSIYVIVGSDQSAVHTSGAYERFIFGRKSFKTKVKLNYGFRSNSQRNTMYNDKVTQSFGSLSAVQLLGIFELNAGVAIRRYKFGFNNTPISFTEEYYMPKNDFRFYGNLGLRLDTEWFMLRAGVGNFDLMYLGIGINF